MHDEDEGMYADGYEDFSDESGGVLHAYSQPCAFAMCGAPAFCCC